MRTVDDTGEYSCVTYICIGKTWNNVAIVIKMDKEILTNSNPKSCNDLDLTRRESQFLLSLQKYFTRDQIFMTSISKVHVILFSCLPGHNICLVTYIFANSVTYDLADQDIEQSCHENEMYLRVLSILNWEFEVHSTEKILAI